MTNIDKILDASEVAVSPEVHRALAAFLAASEEISADLGFEKPEEDPAGNIFPSVDRQTAIAFIDAYRKLIEESP